MLSDIYETSLPTTLRGNDAKEQKFLFRLRDKSLPGAVFKDENDEVLLPLHLSLSLSLSLSLALSLSLSLSPLGYWYSNYKINSIL
jgi:hypothetical protein